MVRKLISVSKGLPPVLFRAYLKSLFQKTLAWTEPAPRGEQQVAKQSGGSS